MALAAGIVLISIVGLAYMSLSPSPGVDSRAVPDINTALTRVPDHDIAGTDLPGVPRPRGATRSYYLDKGQVVTVIYAEHTDVPAVRRELETTLATSGWKSLGALTATPHPVNESLWQAVFTKTGYSLQVEAFRTEDVTGVTYILQNSHS